MKHFDFEPLNYQWNWKKSISKLPVCAIFAQSIKLIGSSSLLLKMINAPGFYRVKNIIWSFCKCNQLIVHQSVDDIMWWVCWLTGYLCELVAPIVRFIVTYKYNMAYDYGERLSFVVLCFISVVYLQYNTTLLMKTTIYNIIWTKMANAITPYHRDDFSYVSIKKAYLRSFSFAGIECAMFKYWLKHAHTCREAYWLQLKVQHV